MLKFSAGTLMGDLSCAVKGGPVPDKLYLLNYGSNIYMGP